MRIRTLLGPPLTHEIVRDTATAIVLFTNDEKPASAQTDPITVRMSRAVLRKASPQWEQDSRAR